MNSCTIATEVFKLCTQYYEAMHICLSLDVWSQSDVFLDAIYATLRGRPTLEAYAAMQAVRHLNAHNEGQAVAAANDEALQNEHIQEFTSWLCEQFETYEWPIEVLIERLMQAVHWLETARQDRDYDDVCDVINTVFGDAHLSDGLVTFCVYRSHLDTLLRVLGIAE